MDEHKETLVKASYFEEKALDLDEMDLHLEDVLLKDVFLDGFENSEDAPLLLPYWDELWPESSSPPWLLWEDKALLNEAELLDEHALRRLRQLPPDEVLAVEAMLLLDEDERIEEEPPPPPLELEVDEERLLPDSLEEEEEDLGRLQLLDFTEALLDRLLVEALLGMAFPEEPLPMLFREELLLLFAILAARGTSLLLSPV